MKIRYLNWFLLITVVVGGPLLLRAWPTADAQGGIVYNALPAFYQEQTVFYYIFDNGTPILDEGHRVAVIDQYRLVDANGDPIEGQFDIIPDGGPYTDTYSDLREIVEVTVPSDYEANRLTSVTALEEAGLLAEANVNRTGITVNVPVVFPGAILQGRERPTETIWSGGQELSVFNFGPTPAQTAPIYLLVTDEAGTRFDGVSSIIEQMHDDEGYSDFWQIFQVRVPPDTDPNSIRSYDDIIALGLPIQETSAVVNCPSIRLEHMNTAYFNDTLYHITQVERPDLPFEDNLPVLYIPDTQSASVLQAGPGDENYVGVCRPEAVNALDANLTNLLTNAAFIEENTETELLANITNSCAVLAEVLPDEVD